MSSYRELALFYDTLYWKYFIVIIYYVVYFPNANCVLFFSEMDENEIPDNSKETTNYDSEVIFNSSIVNMWKFRKKTLYYSFLANTSPFITDITWNGLW